MLGLGRPPPLRLGAVCQHVAPVDDNVGDSHRDYATIAANNHDDTQHGHPCSRIFRRSETVRSGGNYRRRKNRCQSIFQQRSRHTSHPKCYSGRPATSGSEQRADLWIGRSERRCGRRFHRLGVGVTTVSHLIRNSPTRPPADGYGLLCMCAADTPGQSQDPQITTARR